MISKAFLFRKKKEPLLNERLIKEDGFLVDLQFDKTPLPSTFRFKGNNFYRYMDRLFSPIPIEKLNSKQSVSLCDIRLRYFEKLIDSKLNTLVIDQIATLLTNGQPQQINILDFGSGNGKYTLILKNYFPYSEVFGIDISSLAIEYSRRISNDVFWLLVSEKENLPFKDGYFTYIVSTFVMHLDIDKKILNELHRVLRQDGSFVFNIYNKKYLKEGLFDKFNKAGFYLSILPTINLPTNHILILARKRVIIDTE